MATEPTTAERLAEARTVKHRLLMGELEISVSYKERTMMFKSVDILALDKYIAELENQLRCESGLLPRVRSYNVIF